MKRAILYSAIVFAALVAFVMTEGRLYAMHVYGAPCTQATGFAGFLQRTNFLPAGNCTVSGPTCTSIGTVCTAKNPVSGAAVTGKCQTAPSGNGCVCVQVP